MINDEDDLNLAVYCDFENVALGVRDTKFPKFDIQLVLERLLLKGSIVVKKAYCDWDRYKEFKPVMHEASFELIEIPHTRMSGKNSADIRLVVDALDLCYTKEHIDTFVIISGDSDFSPLVSKLRENDKLVIGVGVKNSTSDLLINNCDEFIYYDDLVRENQIRSKQSQQRKEKKTPVKVTPAKAAKSKKAAPVKVEESPLDEAVGLIMETAEALYEDHGHGQTLWGSMIKQTIKRRKPGFNERFYGVRSFGELLEEAQTRGLLKLELDDRSGGYIVKKI
ncbi:MAG: hypothetical protein ACI9GW_000587 [Halieaceae bacterium]|jgi:uncharacterized protein (TIGR00288 family)